MAMTLASMAPGEKARILCVGGAAQTNRRLAEMGVIRQTVVEIQRIAPLGDPIEIKVRGYSLALRKAEAEGIQVEEVR